MIYENGTLKRILTDGGYIEGGAYYFYVKDHEGNNRVVADAGGTAVQSTHYYPFGMSYAEGNATSNQPYRYNGKELDTERGLNWYDYGARFYDPAMTRWTTQDPKAEKYYSMSPYTYCGDNPVKYVDPDGRILKFALGVSDRFKALFKATITYLNKHNAGGIIQKIQNNTKVIYIIEDYNNSSFSPTSNTIKWDPNMGVITDKGIVMSPATVLNHEADHALQEITNRSQKKKDANTPDAQYGNKEEKRVIEGSEQDTELVRLWWFYDPAMARWTTQDPLAEKYCNVSTYTYCGDNQV